MSKSAIELIQELFTQAEVEVDQFNEVFDAQEKLAQENNFLKMQLETVQGKLAAQVDMVNAVEAKFNILESQSEQVYSNGEKNIVMAKQATRERDQMVDKLAQATDLLKDYKSIDTPKKIRAKNKDYQERIAKALKNVDAHKNEMKLYRRDITELRGSVQTLKASETQSNMTTVWSENGDCLLLFPAKLSMKVGDHIERQLTLLYMTKSGCGKLIGLDEEGTPQVCSMPKGGLKPKAKTLEVAGEMLRKFKRQDWKLTVSDLDLGSK